MQVRLTVKALRMSMGAMLPGRKRIERADRSRVGRYARGMCTLVEGCLQRASVFFDVRQAFAARFHVRNIQRTTKLFTVPTEALDRQASAVDE